MIETVDAASQNGPSPDALPAELREKYAFVRWLGHGSTSMVYLGRHTDLNHQVVVKVLSIPDPVLEERFLREARVLASLRHPGIGQLLDFGKVGERTYMTSMYENGRTLAAILGEERRLPWRVVAGIGRTVAGALAEVHAKAIVHRDVKPGNIILAADGAAKLIDFGFSRLPGSTLTAIGEYLGTPSYSAPEHCHSGHCDSRSDLYSLGVVLYEALVGTNPFRGGTAAAELQRQLCLRVDDFPATAPKSPESLRELVLSLLQKNSSDRPASAAEVAAALDAMLQSKQPLLVGGRELGADRGARQQESGASRALPGIVALASLAAVAAVIQVSAIGPRGPTSQVRVVRPSSVPAAARARELSDQRLRFSLSPAGRVEWVELELDDLAAARIEEEDRAPAEWLAPQRTHRLSRVVVSPSHRFRVAIRQTSGELQRSTWFEVDAAAAVEAARTEPSELASFSNAIRRAMCEAVDLSPAQAGPHVLDGVRALPVTGRLCRLRPYLATPSSADCRYSLAGRRILLGLKLACLDLWRAARFLEGLGGDAGVVRNLAPRVLWPELVSGSARGVIAAVDCLPVGERMPLASCPADCLHAAPPAPLATCFVDVPATAAARLVLEVELECPSPHRFTRLDISGISSKDGALLAESLPLSVKAGKCLAPIDAAFLTCPRLRLAFSPECSPGHAGAGSPGNLRLGPARLLMLAAGAAGGGH